MSLHHYRYGLAGQEEGLYIGVAHYLPRGVRREDFAARGYFDVWMPLLAPDGELVTAYRKGTLSFAQFARRYRRQMRQPSARHVQRLVAAIARHQPVHLGCFCADAGRCHRTILHGLIAAEIETLRARPSRPRRYASPACAMPEIAD